MQISDIFLCSTRNGYWNFVVFGWNWQGKFLGILVCWVLGNGSLFAWNSMLTIEDYYSILFPVHAYLGHSIHGFNEIRHSSSVGFCISIEKKKHPYHLLWIMGYILLYSIHGLNGNQFSSIIHAAYLNRCFKHPLPFTFHQSVGIDNQYNLIGSGYI